MSNSKVMIGDRLKHLLEINEMDISKGSLMDEHGFNKSNLHKYITNVRRPALEDIIKLANIFNTTVDYLVGNREYILDTWDHEYLEEFTKFASEEIQRHFIERQNLNISNNDPTYTVLFGLTHLIFSEGLSFEDLLSEEKENQKELFEYIITIFYGLIRMSKQDNFHIDEFKGMMDGILNYIDGEYSFKNAAVVNNIEKLEEKTNEDRIEILKSYIHVNIANQQKALKLLEELSDKK